MIKVKHPEASCNQTQQATLAQLPESQQRFQALFYSYANAVYRYHQAAQEHQPTHQDYEEWLEGLPEAIRKGMAAKGFEQCRTILSFTRYVNEKHDVGMEAYVCRLMGKQEYQEFKTLLS
ncbi:hypothetical protein I2I11_20450 [Pontibacter sp. 172403-2]|uniref:hypothetical protein n=1 Tax=Pontibacter rufus TaxID=2791028 RepID=UPI0018AFC9F8|nr:hypothetical protein [Pontibacter sp. 172403-2]MBF9255680.1 hypothetical protein [Pontibacter sp. 172403-2]